MRHADSSYRNGSLPSVLLVHGGFCDASSWAGVIAELRTAGTDVIAPANPLRGLGPDAAYLAGLAAQIDGPVLLVGHCYGGAVITAVGASAENVIGLVFVTAYALDEGESCVDVWARFPATQLAPALRPLTFLDGDDRPAVELYVRREAFSEILAADLPDLVVAAAAACQRPVAATAFRDSPPAAGWRQLPSWYVVATANQAIHPDAQRFMARRAGAHTVEIDASNSVASSHPAEVADLIRTAMATAQSRRRTGP